MHDRPFQAFGGVDGGDGQVVLLQPGRPGQVGTGDRRIQGQLGQRIMQRRLGRGGVSQAPQVSQARWASGTGRGSADPDRHDRLGLGRAGSPTARSPRRWRAGRGHGDGGPRPAGDRLGGIAASSGGSGWPAIRVEDVQDAAGAGPAPTPSCRRSSRARPGRRRIGHDPGGAATNPDVAVSVNRRPPNSHVRDLASRSISSRSLRWAGADRARLVPQRGAILDRLQDPATDLPAGVARRGSGRQGRHARSRSLVSARSRPGADGGPGSARSRPPPGSVVAVEAHDVQARVVGGQVPQVRRVGTAEP